MNTTNKIRYVHTKTGEIFNSDEIIVEKELSESQYKSIKGTNDYINDNLGYYFHLIYEDLLKLNLESQMVIRFLKLCCYSDYNNILSKGYTKGKINISENELQNILNLSKSEYFKTKKYLVENNLISIKNNTITLNEKYSSRGELPDKFKSTEFTRIFSKGFQELYDKVKPIQHKKLAIFIQILPYINIHYNIICENPHEKDAKCIKSLSWTELGRKIGLSESTSKRLKKELWNLEIDDTIVCGEFNTKYGKFIVINPRIYYKGNNISNLKGIIELFKINSINYYFKNPFTF